MNVLEFWVDAHIRNDTGIYAIIAIVPCAGTYELRGQDLHIVRTFRWGARTPSTYRLATPEELREIDWCAERDCIDIVRIPSYGLFGGQGLGRHGTTLQGLTYSRKVLWQASGKTTQE